MVLYIHTETKCRFEYFQKGMEKGQIVGDTAGMRSLTGGCSTTAGLTLKPRMADVAMLIGARDEVKPARQESRLVMIKLKPRARGHHMER